MLNTLINGEYATVVAVTDRALHYGDGVFETIAVRGGQTLLWESHLQRLYEGCHCLRIPAPPENLLADEAQQLCAGQAQAVLKIIITRGSGTRGYRVPVPMQPTRILSLLEYTRYPSAYAERGVNARLCSTALAENPALAGIKHLNRLEQIMARLEWDDAAISEGIMLNGRGEVIEGTMSNLFLVRDGCLYTPDLTRCGVAGVMRKTIVARAAAVSIPCAISALTANDLATADEVFLCGSLIGIWPVRRLETWSYALGPITQRLSQAIADVCP